MRSAASILAIPEDRPDKLFTKGSLAAERKALMKEWHPDLNRDPQAAAVAAHIQVLFSEAERRIESGTWVTPGQIIFDRKGGTSLQMTYRVARVVDAGTLYLGHSAMTYVMTSALTELRDHAHKRISALPFKDAKMADQMAAYLPKVWEAFDTEDSACLAMTGGRGELILADVLAHFSGKLPPVHAAWIISSLWNIAAYAQVSRLSLPGMTIDGLTIDPVKHTARLIGGWWCAVDEKATLSLVPGKVLSALPSSLFKDKIAHPRINGEIVKAIGREILGDITGARLRRDKEIPGALVDWLLRPARDSAIEDYRTWREQVLPAAFGAPRFVRLELSSTDLYKDV